MSPELPNSFSAPTEVIFKRLCLASLVDPYHLAYGELWQVHHAIGDHANRMVLDSMERALAEVGADDARLRIEHAQILHPDDVPRFAELGVIPSMQPTHCTTLTRGARFSIPAFPSPEAPTLLSSRCNRFQESTRR